ncbi:hypothetical protein OSB04_030016 [Centaurea solstitialis]|uniref:Uncharacterized protein n=1 Tax=Centaurea solstitialis TaxID=347529 RepID=A0AA38S7M5_9ASTR|nr:hypothetical protein OSB04_030016 [Centaurea solstitialis]
MITSSIIGVSVVKQRLLRFLGSDFIDIVDIAPKVSLCDLNLLPKKVNDDDYFTGVTLFFDFASRPENVFLIAEDDEEVHSDPNGSNRRTLFCRLLLVIIISKP